MNLFLLFIISALVLTACGPAATGIPPTAQPPAAAPPTPALVISDSDQAIAVAKEKFPPLKDIKQTPPQTIGASTNITVLDQRDGWNLVFWQGSGDCPAGCINNHYWYVTVSKRGDVTLAGEYVREFNTGANAMQERGQPMWGIPK